MLRDYKNFIKNLKLLRRKRYISEFVSMCVSHSHKCVYLSSDGGRLCRLVLK
jgi:DNA-directed RNA polymerase III subunit RPC2